jgi:hypothetical protein
MPIKSKIRVNLHVFARDGDGEGRAVYNVVHVGFFPRGVVASVVENIAAAGLAYHAGGRGQIGHAEVVTYDMALESHDLASEVIVRRVDYGPPERSFHGE